MVDCICQHHVRSYAMAYRGWLVHISGGLVISEILYRTQTLYSVGLLKDAVQAHSHFTYNVLL